MKTDDPRDSEATRGSQDWRKRQQVDLELKGVQCLGGSQCFVAFLTTNVLPMNQGGTG